MLSWKFFNGQDENPVEGQPLQQKDKKKEKALRNGQKTIKNCLEILISEHARAKKSESTTLVERKTCCHVAKNAFLVKKLWESMVYSYLQ